MAQRPQHSDDSCDVPPTQSRPPGHFKVGRIAGSDVLVSGSWFLIAALIALVVAPRVESVQPGLGAWKYAVGLAFAVLLYGSVLLHEASHAYMARHYGFRVSSITLHFLGGMTAIEGESRNPRQEFWIAVVGPITSIAVGLAALLGWLALPEGLPRMLIEGLAFANLLVGVINLVPGLPLDGGRVLKAMVWGVTGNPYRGSIVAGWGGRVVALAVLVWPFVQSRIFGVKPEVFDFLIVGVLAFFLWTGATQAMAHARFRQRVPLLNGRQLARRTLTLSDETPVSEAVRRAQEAGAGSIVTTSASGAPIGIVNEAAVEAIPDERRPWMPLSSVARTLERGLSLPADIHGEELIKAISRRPAHEYLLVESDGSIFGVLATADVDRAFQAAKS